MIEIVVVDSSAEARNALANKIILFQAHIQQKNPSCPQLSVRVLSLQELPFTDQPDICVIGGECLATDLVEIATIRNHLPEAKLIADCPDELNSLVIIEQMGRLGVDDIINSSSTADDFFGKLVLLNKRPKNSTEGKLIVFDSGKGGTGVTSLVAATASNLYSNGLKVAIIDLDQETQDLTRFLNVRPVVNENLNAILVQERAIVKEFVEQTVVPIWGLDGFVCVPPPIQSLQALSARTPLIRSFLSYLEQLDNLYDVVLVDIAGIRQGLYNALLRIADLVVFVTNPEPASMFATTQVVKETLRLSPHPDAIRIVQNTVAPGGMFPKLVQVEFLRALKLQKNQCSDFAFPYVTSAAKWPGSGMTFDGTSKNKYAPVMELFLSEIGFKFDKPKNSITKLKKSFVKTIASGFSFGSTHVVAQKIAAEKISSSLPMLPEIEAPKIHGLGNQSEKISLPVFE